MDAAALRTSNASHQRLLTACKSCSGEQIHTRSGVSTDSMDCRDCNCPNPSVVWHPVSHLQWTPYTPCCLSDFLYAFCHTFGRRETGLTKITAGFQRQNQQLQTKTEEIYTIISW